MRKILFHNWGLKLASIVLAIILWFLVVIVIDDPQSRTFRNVQVELVNTELLEQENKVYEVLDNTDTVNVSVTAPSSVLSQINENDIVVSADVSRLTDISTIPIEVEVSNLNVISTSTSREVVRLNVEDKASKYVPLTYSTEGEVAEGYMIGNVTMDQNMIEISGPQSAVNEVRSAKVNVNVTNASSSLSANMEIHLYDQDGNEMTQESIRKQTSYVRVSVEVLLTKNVPIYVYYSGAPADGCLTTGEIDTDPGSVMVAGTATSLAGISEISIPKELIDITGAEEDVVAEIDVRELLPDNVRLADSGSDGKVTVTIHVEKESEKRLDILPENLSIVNVPEGLVAELPDNAESYIVTVTGLQELLDQVTEGSITGRADVAAWMEEQEMTALTPGAYNIPVDLQLPDGVRVSAPLTVHVVVHRAE